MSEGQVTYTKLSRRPAGDAAPRPAGRRDALAALLVVGVAVGAVVLVLQGRPAGGGDSGQWVMLARAYAGLPVPAYRDVAAYPPLAPLLVLGLWKLSGDPFVAASLALVASYALLCLASFMLARELFGTGAGVLAGLLVGVAQPYYLWLLAFGTLPQLLSLAAFGAALAAAARWSRRPTLRNQMLILLAASAVMASHAPTAALGLPVLGLVLLLVPRGIAPQPAAGRPRAGVRAAVARAWPVGPPLALFGAYAWAKRDTYAEYILNDAAAQRNGLGVAAQELLGLQPYPLLLLAGAGVLGVLLARGAAASRALRSLAGAPLAPGTGRGAATAAAAGAGVASPQDGGPPPAAGRDPSDVRRREAVLRGAVLGVPLVALGLATVAFELADVGVDYPRVFALSGFTALIGLAALLPRRSPRRRATVPRPGPRRRRAAALAIVALLLAAPYTAGVLAQAERTAAHFSLRYPDAFRDVVREVEQRVPLEQTVWAPIREGKWLEGVTGRAALFELPAWAIYRPAEWDRKAAAATLKEGSAWLSSGLVGAGLTRSLDLSREDWVVHVYYKGYVQPLLLLDDAASAVRLAGSPPVEVRLAELPERTLEARVEGERGTVEERLSGWVPRDGGAPVRVEVLRRVALERGGASLRFEVAVQAQGAGIEEARLELRPAGGYPWALEPLGDGVRVQGLGNAQPLPAVTRAEPPGAVRFELLALPDGRGGARASLGSGNPSPQVGGVLVVEGEPVGRPAPRLQAFTAEQALEELRVAWALFPRRHFERQVAAAELLGFRPVYENSAYVLLQRDAREVP